jgi:uncharacterized protein (DUF433 family)
MRWFEEHITRMPGVQGGEPIIRGTRTPVRTIAVLFTETYPGDIERVMASLPHLSQTQVKAALDYYSAYKNEVDSEIEHHRKALRELSQAS